MKAGRWGLDTIEDDNLGWSFLSLLYLVLDNVPVKHCEGVVLMVLVSYNFLYHCLSDAPVINLLK